MSIAGDDEIDDDDSCSTESEYTESDDDLALLNMAPRQMLAKLEGSNKRLIYLRQCAGGIYTLPMAASSTGTGRLQEATTICTTGCLTCVGVFIPIDDKRCFAAHLDGKLYVPLWDYGMWQVPVDLVTSLKNAVRSSLDHTFQDLQVEVQSIRERQDLRDRVIVVCPWQIVGGQKATGFHIVDVLCEYFQLDRNSLASKYSGYHGFIVDHFNKAPIQPLGWKRPGPTDRDLDEIAKIADNCAKPLWGENFRSVFRATYEYVMYYDFGWEQLLPDEDRDDDREMPWLFEFDKGVWRGGSRTPLRETLSVPNPPRLSS